MAEFIANTEPKLYGKYVIEIPNRSLMLYVQLKKALYSLIRSVFIFYEELVGDLEVNGLKPNPHDCCVENKMVNGKN